MGRRLSGGSSLILVSYGEIAGNTTLTRSTTGTYFGADGVLRTAAINAVRTDYNPANGTLRGLLVEIQGTNKCTNYNLNPDAGLTNISASAGTLDRVNDAANLPFDGGTVGGNVFHLNNATGSPVTITVTGTTGNTNKHSIRVFARFTGTAPTLQLTGAVGAVACNNAYAETKSDNITPGTTADQWQLVVPNGTEVWFLGNQLEEGPFVTSPIETAGAAVTRAADNVTSAIVGTLPDEFSFVFEGTTAPGLGAQYFLDLNDGSNNNRISFNRGNDGSVRLTSRASSVLTMNNLGYPGTVSTLSPIKIAVSLSTTGVRMSVNGAAVEAFSGGVAVSAFTKRDIGKLFSATSQWSGWVKNLTEYPRAMSDAELIAESSL